MALVADFQCLHRHRLRPDQCTSNLRLVNVTTPYRWVQKFGPELTKRAEKFLRRASVDWHVDETYVRVGGKWRYLWGLMPESAVSYAKR